jgi:hypothetical protein
MLISPPSPLPLLPTERSKNPPRPDNESPELITIDPLGLTVEVPVCRVSEPLTPNEPAFEVNNMISPLEPDKLLPLTNRIFPPVLSTLFPDVNSMSPPVPLRPDPTLNNIEPEMSDLESPVLKVIPPLVDTALPVVNIKDPLEPLLPLLLVTINIDPLDESVLPPLASDIDPPALDKE